LKNLGKKGRKWANIQTVSLYLKFIE
jgi:hypothetical protein